MDYYKLKYRFQWWWYAGGAKETFEGILMTAGGFALFYLWWTVAYLYSP